MDTKNVIAAISLSAYAGQIVRVRMSYTSGTSYQGDCAIDYLRFMEAPLSGCMDPFAVNYNASANADCDSIGGGNNTSCCVYPTANLAPFCEDWESGITTTIDWLNMIGSA